MFFLKMCTRPLVMKKRNFRYLLYSRNVIVPCGECAECRKKRANEIYVRARMEYDNAYKKGGNGFMCCLTYSDDLVPTIDFNGSKVMVFNKMDVINFIKRLRINISRYYDEFYPTLVVPSFKYLVTSEYGTDENYSHRPHYHLIFIFSVPCIPSAFKKCFTRSLYSCRFGEVKWYFGYIKQCDLIDPKKGGIQYSSKYVCKDIMYEPQNLFIRQKIKDAKTMINKKYGIVYAKNSTDEFKNSCIRSTTDYKHDVETYVRPWRHMLQFYMCSNDLGASAIVEKYGKDLCNMSSINFDGFPYSIPKLAKKRYEERYGVGYLAKLAKNCFYKYVDKVLNDLVNDKTIPFDKAQDLRVFAHEYVYPYKGNMRLVLPFFDLNGEFLFPVKDWKDLVNEFSFYEDNDFFTMRDDLECVLKLYNSEERLMFREKLAKEKEQKNKEEQQRRKRNKNK